MDKAEDILSAKSARRVAVALAVLVCSGGLAPGAAEAHDQWINGSSIPDWVKKQCCGEADAHHLQPSQVHVTEYGYQVDGYTGYIPERRRLQSPDGEWWVFYRVSDTGEQSQVYCFFGPPEGS